MTKKAVQLEEAFGLRLSEMVSNYTISVPNDVGFGEELTKDLTAYDREFRRLDKDVFAPLKSEFRRAFGEEIGKAAKAVDGRAVGRELLNARIRENQNTLNGLFAEVVQQSKILMQSFDTKAKETRANFQNEVRRLQTDFDVKTRGKVTDTKIYNSRQYALDQLEITTKDSLNTLQYEIHKIDSFMAPVGDGLGVSRELVAALEEKTESLTEELEQGLELMQLGAALGIVQHEFLSAIQDVRSGINNLRPWADENPELIDIYRGIHSSFDHLSGYLKLFDPYSRRLNPVKVVISGGEIRKYLEDLFGTRLDRESIKLKATPSFTSKKIEGYTSTFYPVFANLIDNAIYWLSNYRESGRSITLDVNIDGFLVKDNGPGIEPRYEGRIFEFGFSRKSVGRGMGLHISREALRREDLDLVLLHSDGASGTTFLIKLGAPD